MPIAAPTAAQVSWVGDLIGGPPDLSIVVRPSALRADPYWGPTVARALAAHDLGGDIISQGSVAVLANAQQIELHVVVRDPLRWANGQNLDPRSIGWVGIVHGLGLDPGSFRSGAGRPMFAAAERLPSGVVAYAPDAAYAEEYGLFAPTLFILPDGTAVVTEQVSAPRARDALARNGTSPAALATAPEALGGIVMGISTLHFLSAGKADRASISQGATAMGFGLRGGANGAVEGYADYATTDDAARAYAALERACAERSDGCTFAPGMFKDAKAERSGGRISVSLVFTEATLRSIGSLGK